MSLRRRLFEAFHPARLATYPRAIADLPTIDLGCGPHKRRGAIGLDIEPGPGIDHVVDFEREPLPFADGAVGYVYSSHCLEHLRQPMPVMKELTRVAADGAGLEIWLPYGFHNEGQLVDHYVLWNEEQFIHISALFPQIWAERLGGGWWELDELVFHVEENTLNELIRHGDALPYALKFYRNVVRELGILGHIRKGRPEQARKVVPKRTFVVTRNQDVRRPVEPVGLLDRAKSIMRR